MSNNTENQNEESGNNPSDSTITAGHRLLNLSRTVTLKLAKFVASLGMTVFAATLTTAAVGVLAPLAITTALVGTLAIGANVVKVKLFPPPIESKVVDFVGTFETDKLFTSYAIMPVVLLELLDNQDHQQKVFPDLHFPDGKIPGNLKPAAYCSMQYKVSFGYENVQNLITDDKNIKAACAGKFSELPQPKILSKKLLHTAESNLTEYDCDQYGSRKSEDGELVLDSYIGIALNVQTKSLSSLIDKSQKALGAFIKINCPDQK